MRVFRRCSRKFCKVFQLFLFARDLEIEGNYLVTNRGIFEYQSKYKPFNLNGLYLNLLVEVYQC